MSEEQRANNLGIDPDLLNRDALAYAQALRRKLKEVTRDIPSERAPTTTLATMTEQEWSKSQNPSEMFAFANGNNSSRKGLLFQVACCTPLWEFLNEPGRDFIEVYERLADKKATNVEAREAIVRARDSLTRIVRDRENRRQGAEPADESSGRQPSADDLLASALNILFHLSDPIHLDRSFRALLTGMESFVGDASIALNCREYFSHLIREIYGNPFHPYTGDFKWRSATVLDVAGSIYSDRAWEGMQVLGDALMDAGCDDESILDHCRSTQLHVRGCWVVDLVLGYR